MIIEKNRCNLQRTVGREDWKYTLTDVDELYKTFIISTETTVNKIAPKVKS